MNPIKVVLYDDNDSLRESLVEIIDDSGACKVIGSFSNCLTVEVDMNDLMPDVVIMDINMPERNGIEGVKLIKKNHPEIQIVMQTVFDDDKHIFEAISSGASGYITKNYSSENIINIIVQVHEGGAPMSPPIARKVLEKFRGDEKAIVDHGLSPKEKEVLQHLVNGLAYKQIAAEMMITYDTVRAHIKKIYEKLHVHSMTEAVVKAVQFKIL